MENTEEYWKMKRAKSKEKVKDNKRKFNTKEEYVESEEWRKNQEREKRRKKWRDVDKEEIEFHKPEIVLDLSYSDVMNEKEQSSAVTQLVQIYGILKASPRPLKTHFCSVTGSMETRLDKADVKHWKVWTHSEKFNEVFPQSSLVYLSPDSPNVLEQLDPTKVYVIGGLVDHNKLKGLSLKRATEMELETARLPMSEILTDRPNTSLNQNHGNLEEALKAHTPHRRGYQRIIKSRSERQRVNADGAEGETPNTNGSEK